jgi:hypothetical protein
MNRNIRLSYRPQRDLGFPERRPGASEKHMNSIGESGRLLIRGMRYWMMFFVHGSSISSSVSRSFAPLGDRYVLRSIAAALILAARDANRSLRVHPPCCSELSTDEREIALALECYVRGLPSAGDDYLRRVVRAAPSRALTQHIRRIAGRFKAAGLGVATAAGALSAGETSVTGEAWLDA